MTKDPLNNSIEADRTLDPMSFSSKTLPDLSGSEVSGADSVSFGSLSRAIRPLRTALSRDEQLTPCHPKAGECKQHAQMGGVLVQTTVSHLRVAELPLLQPERFFSLSANLGFKVLQLAADSVDFQSSQQGSAFRDASPLGKPRSCQGSPAVRRRPDNRSRRTPPVRRHVAKSCATTTSAMLAAVPTTVFARPVSTSVPKSAFIP